MLQIILFYIIPLIVSLIFSYIKKDSWKEYIGRAFCVIFITYLLKNYLF